MASLLRALLALFCVAVLVFQAASLGYMYVYAHTELPKIPPLPRTSFVLTEDGEVLAALHGPVDRTPVSIEDLPSYLVHAVIAAEDEGFYREGGISVSGILRAALVNLKERNLTQGGSTITQQFVKNRITGSEVSFGRKIREAILAQKLARRYPKDTILEHYLNSVYLGEGAYGIQAAARRYFGIDAADLTLNQAATLAGIIPAPERFDPLDHPVVARARRDLVLERMAELGFISEQRAELVASLPVWTDPEPDRPRRGVGYFLADVARFVQRRFGVKRTFEGGLRITATIDLDMQEAARAAVRAYLPRPSDPDAALVAIDTREGYVRAIYGGRNYRAQPFDLATQGRRQTGSAAKVFTLVAAIERGIPLSSMWSGPGTIVIRDPRCRGPGGMPWVVSNYSDSGVGTMTLVDATVYSVNTIYAQLVTKVGPDAVVEVAHRLGIDTPMTPVCSVTLGSQSVTPLEMTSAFATLASGGIYHEPLVVSSVRTPAGRELLRRDPDGERVIELDVAQQVNAVLMEVVERGTGTAARLTGRQAAGKTGTAQNHQDAWFCGFVRQLAACVWVGYREGQIPMTDIGGFSNVYGGSIPALIWRSFMERALAGEPRLPLVVPQVPAPEVRPSPAAAVSQPPELASATPGASPSRPAPPPPSSTEPTAEPSASPTPGPGGGRGG